MNFITIIHIEYTNKYLFDKTFYFDRNSLPKIIKRLSKKIYLSQHLCIINSCHKNTFTAALSGTVLNSYTVYN